MSKWYALAVWLAFVCSCAGPRIVVGDAGSLTAPSRPVAPPRRVAAMLDAPAASPSPSPSPSAPAPTKKTIYRCPMHHDVTSEDPNARCGKCGMALEATP